MLVNNPPAGTKVRFLREVRKARTNSVGTLKKKGDYFTESHDDLFEVEFEGETITVRRGDIEKV
jgi:hypothetical protein